MSDRKHKVALYVWKQDGRLEVKSMFFHLLEAAISFAKKVNADYGHHVKVYDDKGQLCETYGVQVKESYA
jgi:hypothetical protein